MKIFVTVGTHPQQFNRLLVEIDKIAGAKRLEAKVFAQAGNSGFVPKNFSFRNFLQPLEMRKRIAESDVVISHGGAGSIIDALALGKPLVIVPRLKQFGEHTNDHQRDLALAMEKAGKAIAVFEISGLEGAIAKAQSLRLQKGSGAAGIIKELESFFGKGAFVNG